MNKGLRAKRDALELLWKEGLSGHALLEKHTKLIDSALEEYFKKSKADQEDMALVALGGYGRKELFPYSDIDLMLLYHPASENKLNDVTEALFYPLWDAGLEVGHGVRTKERCLEEASKDFFLQVSLLDARLIAGPAELFNSLIDDFQKVFIEGQRKTFLTDMLFHREKRHKRFGNHTFLLEPHIKESRGGFRDIQAMIWSAQVIFGLKKPEDLETAGLLTQKELQSFKLASNDLIRIRNRLHYICGRKNDQLYFEHQEEIAKAFNFKDQKGILGVERFMRETHGHMQTIAVTTDLFFEHATEVLGLVKNDKKTKQLEPGLTLRQGRIHLTDPNLANKRPHLLMRACTHVAQTGAPLHHRTKKMIGQMLNLIDDKARNSKLMSRAFLEAIQNPKAPLQALNDMLESGLLGAYIPELHLLKSLAQHDIYHVFTVDRHLLQTVEEMNKLRESEYTLFISVPSQHLLFLASLLHDIGKGYGKDHAEYGAELTKNIVTRLGLSEGDTKCLTFLVREHLYLAETAQRRDLEDEALIIRCAKHIGDTDRLTMLYLLTIADARATGPSAWSDWKAALLLELYLKTANVLSRGDLSIPDHNQEADWMRNEVAKIIQNKSPVSLDILTDDYLSGFTPQEVARHIKFHKLLRQQEIILKASQHEGHWKILIMTKDRPGILNKICGVFTLHNLKVHAAQIYTWDDGTVVDEIQVSPTLDSNFADQDWQALEDDLGKAFNFRLGLPHRLHKKLQPYGPNPSNMGTRPPAKVVLNTTASDSYTIIEVFAKNRPGLLYDITHTLSDFGINTYRAKISTKGDQIVDVFYVLDNKGEKIKDKKFQTEITNGLLHAAA